MGPLGTIRWFRIFFRLQGIKVLWRLQFLEYLRTRNCSLHNTLIPNLVKPLGTIHSNQTSQEGIQCTKAKEKLRPYSPNIYTVPRIFFHFSWILVADDSVSCFPLTSFRRSSVRSWCNCNFLIKKRNGCLLNCTFSVLSRFSINKNWDWYNSIFF